MQSAALLQKTKHSSTKVCSETEWGYISTSNQATQTNFLHATFTTT